MENIKKYCVVGVRWFDKDNGNSYFNAKIVDVQTNTKYYVGYQYGYGSSYLYASIDFIKDNLSKDDNCQVIDMGIFDVKKSIARNGWF